MEKAFLTQNLIKPHVIGRETTECCVNIKILTNRQKKKRKKKKQSQQIYVHTHEEKSRQWIGERAMIVGIDKPRIFTLW